MTHPVNLGRPLDTNLYTTNFPFKRWLPFNLEACYTCAPWS